jgi:hypothetical protein
MAYNVLKGNVQFINSDSGSIESMVDDYSNQTIAGIKTFSSPITSSGFFDSINGTPIVSSPIDSISNSADERIVIFSGANTVEGKTGLTYNDTVLAVTGNISASVNISGSEFYGSGGGLTNLKANSISGQVSAANISLGNGLTNTGGAVTVSGSDTSITIAANGISINGAGSQSGLVVGGSGIRVDPNRAATITSLASGDEFLVTDVDDSNNLKKATITNLQTYMDNTLAFAKVAGSDTQIFFNDGGSNTLGTDATFAFNDTTKVVSATGVSASLNISASQFYGDGANLTSLNATALNGNVPAGNINIGHGLFDQSNKLSVSASFGLSASVNGLEVTASNTSGLNVLSTTGLIISPIRTPAKASPVAADIVLLGDSADSNNVKNATLTSVVTLMQSNGAAGSNTQVQFNNSNAFAGSSNFTFNSATNQLAVTSVSSSANISASFFIGDGSQLENVGGQSAYGSFTANFTVATESDILGIVTTGSAITASLAAANTYGPGQRFTFKDVSGSCSGSNHIVISASAYGSGNRIDGQGIVKIKNAFGAVTIASDGVGSFYIVGIN